MTNYTRIRVLGNGKWIETKIDKCELCRKWNVGFDLPDADEDIVYTLFSYEDENENNVYDNSETLGKLDYRTGDLSILAVSALSYQSHRQEHQDKINFYAGSDGVADLLSRQFLTGAVSSTGYQALVYREKEVGTKADTQRNDYLVNAWTHGAGASMTYSISDGERCEAIVPYYVNGSGTELYNLVLDSGEFKDGLVNVITYPSFKKDILSSKHCADGEEDCLEFVTDAVDADLRFRSIIPHSDSANLFAALGDCKYKYNAKVRYKDGLLFDEYDIKIVCEIYDMYDLNFGKTFMNLDFNSDGAIVEIGYQGGRRQGAEFITSVPFELTYSINCGILECTYSNQLLFSQLSDF